MSKLYNFKRVDDASSNQELRTTEMQIAAVTEVERKASNMQVFKTLIGSKPTRYNIKVQILGAPQTSVNYKEKTTNNL